MLAAGCASRQPALPEVAELADVPFFAQTDYDCGPAALATILSHAGVSVTAADLIDAVYVEGLRGSLQAELVAATRRHGLLPVPLEPDAASLIAELASGRPVLVLQNLGFARVPVWHYAVVVGFDAAADRLVLRSGSERRRLERRRRFMRSWERADHWAFVAARPGDVPASATPGGYTRALVGSARQLDAAAAAAAYDGALARWPRDPLVLFVTATTEHAAGDLAAAASLYRRTLAREPGHAAARNNLANVLLEQGCRDAALREARAALSLEPPDSAFHAAIADTLRQIEQAFDDLPEGPEPTVCGSG